jgi:hypothetical protein
VGWTVFEFLNGRRDGQDGYIVHHCIGPDGRGWLAED